MTDKIFHIIAITLPVFSIIILGKVLSISHFMTTPQRDFITKLTYRIALPILVFNAISKETIDKLFQPSLFVATFGSVLITATLFFILAKMFKLSENLASAFIFSSYWANTAYVGFPIALNAFGQEGLSQAAIINAFCVPLYIPLSLMITNFFRRKSNKPNSVNIFQILNNPIIIAIILGLIVSLIRSILPSQVSSNNAVLNFSKVITSCLDLIGSMGLPLALIAVGASIKFDTIKKVPHLLVVVFMGKMVLIPALAISIIKLLFPGTPQVTVAVAAIILGTPQAVASYVIAKEEGIAEDFVSASLAFTTLGSIISIPIWLYYIL